MDVLSKGGRWRTIPFHPETRRILEAWMEQRDDLISQYPERKVPENILIAYSRRFQELMPMTHDGIYKEVRTIGKRVGIEYVSPHDLRRTFGRTMFFNDIPIEKIAEILGHTNTMTTKKYIGINITDMEKALEHGANYRWGTKTPISYPQ